MTNKLTLKAAIDKLDSKEISVGEVFADTKKAIDADNAELNVYLTLDENLLENPKNQSQKPLRGLPISIKDNFCTRNMQTTAASTVLDGFIPQFDATVVKKLKEAGAGIVGKTNLDAWAHGSSTENSQYNRTLNPRNKEHLPGGSSGGSAAAVAADMCLASIGSETAGSIRQPAAWCGVVGLKPTYGRVSRYGVAAMASSTDSPGPMTKTVEDAALMLNILAGRDPLDASTGHQTPPDFTNFLDKPIKDLKIGVIHLDLKGLDDVKHHYESQLKVFEDLGAKVEIAETLDPHYALSVYTIVQRGEVASNLARYQNVRYSHARERFGKEAVHRVMLGTHTLSKGYADEYYNTAQKVRSLIIQDFEKLFEKYDVLVAPTSPGFAKKVGASEDTVMFGELEDMQLEPSSLAGLPGISVPCYKDSSSNLFLGLNIMAPTWREDLCIQVADAFEKNTQWNTWR